MIGTIIGFTAPVYFNSLMTFLEERNQAAFKRDLFIAIDAEQTYLQDAIRNVAEQFQQIHNGTGRYILNTYQAYLKSTYHHIQVELLKNQYIKKPLAIKLVRGAYLVEESALSAEGGYENPIHNSIEETHTCYDHSAESI
jgi:proline dehydrogenase